MTSMKYILRPGLVLEHIHGKHLLIADEQARKHCKYLTELDPSASAILESLIAGKSIDTMVDEFSAMYQDTQFDIYKSIEDFLRQMEENHFLIVCDIDD